jgi:TonB-dependent SusC/RagA subfamily outer membrane receptor
MNRASCITQFANIHPSPHRRPTGRLAIIALLLVAWGEAQSQQQTGTINGRVTDGATKAPVAAARVFVAGTALRTLTSEDGRYSLRAVPAGSVELAVSRLGYEAKSVALTVNVGQTTTADVELTQTTTVLAEVVTTVTGAQRKVELGNAVATINVAEKLAVAPIKDVSGLLSGRASGVQVVESGMTGSGARIRIRGQSSLSLNNEPIVYIDGVRVLSSSGSSAIGTGGSMPSRLNDINPEEIENIEVIKGPSAATLYGTEAANGVINITTKRGKAGRTRWALYSENGVLFDPNSYPDLWYLYGTTIPGGVAGRCVLTQIAAGTCRADSLITNNVLNNE